MLSSGSLVVVPHVKFGFILFLILIVALGIFASVRFKLNRKIGISFFTMYVAFVIYAYVQDMLCDYDCWCKNKVPTDHFKRNCYMSDSFTDQLAFSVWIVRLQIDRIHHYQSKLDNS